MQWWSYCVCLCATHVTHVLILYQSQVYWPLKYHANGLLLAELDSSVGEDTAVNTVLFDH